MKRYIPLLALVLVLAPAVALAAQAGQLSQVDAFIDNLVRFINATLVPLVFALAFIVFIWGIAQYFIFGASDETKRETGRTYMLYGIAGFVLMVSVWGIVNLLANGLGLTSQEIQNIPNAPTSNN